MAGTEAIKVGLFKPDACNTDMLSTWPERAFIYEANSCHLPNHSTAQREFRSFLQAGKVYLFCLCPTKKPFALPSRQNILSLHLCATNRIPRLQLGGLGKNTPLPMPRRKPCMPKIPPKLPWIRIGQWCGKYRTSLNKWYGITEGALFGPRLARRPISASNTYLVPLRGSVSTLHN